MPAIFLLCFVGFVPTLGGELLVRKIADRILEHQTKDGAILMNPVGEGENLLIPYFSNFAAMGLCGAYIFTGEEKYLRSADAWLDWYARHINPDGTIYDYKGPPSNLKPTGDYDSSDAYAGTFITAVWSRYLAKPDEAFLKRLYRAIKKAVAGIKLTLQTDHLTFAKPTHPVKYLMDNVETWQGLNDAGMISRVLGHKEDEEHYNSLASSMLRSLEDKFWDQENGCYSWAIYVGGTKSRGLKRWYPEQMANLMAIAWLPSSPKRKELYLTLREKLRPWEERDLEKLIWWAMAGRGAEMEEDVNLFVGKILEGDLLSLPPYLLGHLLRLIPGEVKVEPARDATKRSEIAEGRYPP